MIAASIFRCFSQPARSSLFLRHFLDVQYCIFAPVVSGLGVLSPAGHADAGGDSVRMLRVIGVELAEEVVAAKACGVVVSEAASPLPTKITCGEMEKGRIGTERATYSAFGADAGGDSVRMLGVLRAELAEEVFIAKGCGVVVAKAGLALANKDHLHDEEKDAKGVGVSSVVRLAEEARLAQNVDAGATLLTLADDRLQGRNTG
ncbi:hypothetical protein BDK51DRAFT_51578 [Blyttiomyces helicus]|uniref:Uncharacterized protein n=1 Tax=Blyttiomyces helicus TaxID=388810 RepID=A0A4P9WDE9_9FUNG|nr:hypothetical protein BDK51DRAFT_51578 [Blyttiomyces helicus]|eukprot:RKO90372.1 hypothetical protein BDK51DRAFT_51578 [Blyttiomyces helicus]